MTQLIDADALKEAIKDNGYSHYFEIFDIIDNAPTIKPEMPHGKWLTHQTGLLVWEECNQCKAQVGTIGMNYCPNCGARMDAQ